MQVHVAQAELWTLPVDAVVNPANSLGIMGGGIGGAIRRQGGDVIQQAAMAAAPIAVGAALVTTAGQLPSQNVIHVPTMEEPGQKIGAEAVRRAARVPRRAVPRAFSRCLGAPRRHRRARDDARHDRTPGSGQPALRRREAVTETP